MQVAFFAKKVRSSFLVGWVERIGPGDPPFKNNTSPAQVPTLPKIESETQRSLLTLANILAYKVGFRSIFEVICRCIVFRCAWVCVLPLLIRSTQPTGLHTQLTLMVQLGNRPYRRRGNGYFDLFTEGTRKHNENYQVCTNFRYPACGRDL